MTHDTHNAPDGDQTRSQIDLLALRNERLVEALTGARAQIVTLKEQIDDLAQPPGTYAIFLSKVDSRTIDVLASGRKMHIRLSPTVDVESLRPGQEVKLNEAMVAVGAGRYETVGEIATVKEELPDGRVLVVGRTDDERIVRLAGSLDGQRVRVGDSLIFDTRSSFVFEVIPRSEVAELVLEEVPNIDYSDIGGLSSQIEQIRDSIELPLNHADLFREHGLSAPKGVLLYGPPGCGKTLIAKAVANSLARMVAARRGHDPGEVRSYFLNIKGPELLNKYVGETERHIRQIFARAREKATSGAPVVVFFDEMESLFRTRGTGISSDVETTIVPQLLAEIDGVEELDNVIVIGASNREDMIDPAILRPGRLDVKIKIDRPDAEGAQEIFSKYLTPDLPIHEDDLAEHGDDREVTVTAMITRTVERMFSEDEANQFLEVTYVSGDKETLFFKDFASGAMIQNIVDRAKKHAIKDLLASGSRGLRIEHLLTACSEEFKENEDLPNTTNPDDWARVSGKKGERIVFIRTIVQDEKTARPAGRAIDDVTPTGQYL